MPILGILGAMSAKAFIKSILLNPILITKTSSLSNWTTGLSVGGSNTFSNRAVFLGGTPSNFFENSNAVTTYDTSLVRNTSLTMNFGRFLVNSDVIGNFLFIAGGYWDFNGQVNCEYFNTSFVKSNATSLGLQSYGHVGGKVTNYLAYFGLGHNGQNNSTIVDYYSASNLTKGSTTLTRASRGGGTVSFSNNIMYHYAGDSTDIDVYDGNMTKTSTPTSAFAINAMTQGENTDSYNIAFITRTSDLLVKTYAYTSSLTRIELADKQDPTTSGEVAAWKNKVIASGGRISDGTTVGTVTVYDNNLVKSNATPLTQVRSDHFSAGVGNYFIIASGSSSGGGYGTKTNSVEVYTDV